MCRRQLPDAGEDRAVERDVAIGEKVRERIRIEARRETRQLQESLRLGGEGEPPGQGNVVQGLDPDAVAREEESLVARVPESQGEHPFDPGKRLRALATQEAVRHLAVALRFSG